jgi:hypothetical protein
VSSHLTDEPDRATTPKGLSNAVVMSGAKAIAAFTGDPSLQELTALGDGFFGLVNKYMFSRLEKWKLSLDQGFDELTRLRGFDFASAGEKEKDRIVTIVSKATIIAMQDLRQEKRRYLYNAVINSVQDDTDVNTQLMYMHYIDIFNTWHIEMLKAFDRLREPSAAKLTDWITFHELENELPTIPNTVSEQIFTALVTNGLIFHSESGAEYPPNQSAHITELGKAFLRFIDTPSITKVSQGKSAPQDGD